MKKLIYLIMAVWAFTSCNDSDEAFTVEISAEGFHFIHIGKERNKGVIRW